ncbi:MAG TPA: hypothetical protein VG738_09210 [Chitinophagaceae bacterium]|nr:hypothetical protein [Chitinophagaceae bacterium]
MPFYRITVWVKNRTVPYTGVREYPEHNIDSMFSYAERMIYAKMPHESIIDYEVAMLPRGCSAVKKYLRKKAGGDRMRTV